MPRHLLSAGNTIAATLFALLSVVPAYGSDPTGYNISSKVRIKDNERIVGLTITLANGTFRSFSGIPRGWYFRLDNSTHEQEALSGEVSVGAGALYRKELPDVWVCVRASDLAGVKFAISGELWITSDFEKTRKITLTPADFASRPCEGPTQKKGMNRR